MLLLYKCAGMLWERWGKYSKTKSLRQVFVPLLLSFRSTKWLSFLLKLSFCGVFFASILQWGSNWRHWRLLLANKPPNPDQLVRNFECLASNPKCRITCSITARPAISGPVHQACTGFYTATLLNCVFILPNSCSAVYNLLMCCSKQMKQKISMLQIILIFVFWTIIRVKISYHTRVARAALAGSLETLQTAPPPKKWKMKNSYNFGFICNLISNGRVGVD